MPSLALETVANQLLMMYIDPLNLLVNDIAETLDSTAENSSKVVIWILEFVFILCNIYLFYFIKFFWMKISPGKVRENISRGKFTSELIKRSIKKIK